MSKLAQSLIAEYFDADFYLAANPDVAREGVDPLDHYVKFGAREGRSPAPWFDASAHRTAASLGPADDPFLHFITSEPARARQLQSAQSRNPAATGSRRAKPLMQPFYALAPQAAGDHAVVFTAIAGPRHALPNNTTVWPDMRVFGDTPIDLSRWRFQPSLYWDAHPKLTVLFHKYCLASFFPEGTKLIWADSRVSAQQPILEQMSTALDEADLCVFSHYERDCVYDELVGILKGGRASFEEVQDFERRLRDEDFPEHDGLYETGLIGMKAGAATSLAMRRVFGLARRHLARDQVTLPLALRGAGLKLHVFNDGATNLRNTPGVFVHPW